MKGKIINPEHAILNTPKDSSFPEAGNYQVMVNIDPSAKISDDMIGKTFEFEVKKPPCPQFCGRAKQCSQLHGKVCEESTFYPTKLLNERFILQKT